MNRDLLSIIVETTGAVMPESFDSWGIKSVNPDLVTTHGFRWALPGGLNLSNHAFNHENTSPCPSEPGDGLCVATTWQGMASGGIPARMLLLVAYRAADVAGRDPNKLRIKGVVASVELVDGERFIREHGKGMGLYRSNLRGMILQSAGLQGADLRGADLRDADLWGADLRGADLRGADLYRANLCGADLRGSSLRGVNLSDADLWDADLSDADLGGANLRGADLRGTDLQDANLRYADLRGTDLQAANLQGVDLQGAFWPASIATPTGWTRTNDGRMIRKATR